MERRAKILITLGPASSAPEVVGRLLEAGADAVRLNLSHGDHAGHRRMLQTVRREAAHRGRHVPVMMDLMGPRYRLGKVPGGPRRLERGERVVLGEVGEGVDLPLEDLDLLEHLREGQRVLVDNGLVELAVEEKAPRRVAARVEVGGKVSTRKGINLPDSELPFTISEKDRRDVAFAVELGADYLAASYVGRAADVVEIRRVVAACGGELPIVAKLERAAAVDHLEGIIQEADALMVARGDLGVEVPLDQVPVLQKRMVAAGRRTGTPVIVATQMLESMTEQPRPTRAEATDVANAVLDGADALMLSGETAAGRYPVAAVETMARVIGSAEAHRGGDGEAVALRRPGSPLSARPLPGGSLPGGGDRSDPELEIADVVCAAAAHAAGQLQASFIVAFSQGGFTARSIARYRPWAPIRVFTPDAAVARQVELVWGVRSELLENGGAERLEQVVEVVERRLLASKRARGGDTIVLVMADPVSRRARTNLLRLHRLKA